MIIITTLRFANTTQNNIRFNELTFIKRKIYRNGNRYVELKEATNLFRDTQ